jgi:hypothetical protein
VPNRRQFLRRSAALSALGIAPGLVRAQGAPALPPKGRADHCIMIWLGGGMAQIDTFDPKPRGDAKAKTPGSYYASIPTAAPGVFVCEHLQRVAPMMDRLTAVRSVHHDVIDEHAAATNRMHTGRRITGTEVYPSIGSIISHERGAAADGVPAYVVMGYPNPVRGPGFLGAKHGYLYLLDTESGPSGLKRPDGLTDARVSRRQELLATLRQSAKERYPNDQMLADQDAAIGQSLRLAGPDFMAAFDLKSERPEVRESFGGEFGQRCLLARRLVQRGVRFIEVSHNLNFLNGTGWDTHNAGQLNQHKLIQELDQALAALLADLASHQLLDRTLVVVNTEFGRPAAFDGGGGRGHQASAFSLVLAGGGLRHCGAYGATDDACAKPVENPVSVADFFATICWALGVDAGKSLHDGDRPVPITDNGQPISALFV